jgi:hypothetical protein
MSRGPGTLQRRALAALASWPFPTPRGLRVATLARSLFGAEPTRAQLTGLRRGLHSLEERGIVKLAASHRHEGELAVSLADGKRSNVSVAEAEPPADAGPLAADAVQPAPGAPRASVSTGVA